MVVLVPPSVVTVTSTVPALPGGDTAVKEVAPETVTLEAGTVPNCTAASGVNPVPVMATAVPPALGPTAGLSDATVGTGS